MNNLPLQPLVWKDLDEDDKRIFVEHAQGAGIFYTVYGAVDSDFGTRWHDQMEGSHGKKEGFESVDDAKHWIATDHYPSKMQPYVKPLPTWIDVDDMLPEMYKRVLIKADCYLVAGREPESECNKDWGITGEWMWSIVSDSWVDSHMVTHWMPIPEFSTIQNNKGE